MLKKIRTIIAIVSIVIILGLGILSNLVFLGSFLGILLGIYLAIEVPKLTIVKKLLSFIQAIKAVMNDNEDKPEEDEKEVDSNNNIYANAATSTSETATSKSSETGTEIPHCGEVLAKEDFVIDATELEEKKPKQIFSSPEQVLNYVLQGK